MTLDVAMISCNTKSTGNDNKNNKVDSSKLKTSVHQRAQSTE